MCVEERQDRVVSERDGVASDVEGPEIGPPPMPKQFMGDVVALTKQQDFESWTVLNEHLYNATIVIEIKWGVRVDGERETCQAGKIP
jgi:hypothetical protein